MRLRRSAALETKLAELEAGKRTLLAELQAAQTVVQLSDVSVITAKWRAVVVLPKTATPPELGTARKTLQSLLGIVRMDRKGKGYAELSIGVPTTMVAGARYGCSIEPIELRKRS